MNVLYPAQFSFDKEDNRYLVTFPDMPEAVTEGESEEEAGFNFPISEGSGRFIDKMGKVTWGSYNCRNSTKSKHLMAGHFQTGEPQTLAKPSPTGKSSQCAWTTVNYINGAITKRALDKYGILARGNHIIRLVSLY